MMNIVETFRALHADPSQPLVLPNIWDVCGARLIESLGAKAVATTSAGVAWAKGYQDGDNLPVAILAGLANELVRAVKVPVTIDFESGYSDQPATVAENLKPLVAAGISGINIEDGSDSPEVLVKKIEAIKAMLSKEGADLFINLRTDVYLQDLVPDDSKVRETLERARLYKAAGGDGLFVPGLADQADIAEIAAGTDLPLNLMASPSLPKADALTKMGVRRLSAGTAIAQIAYQQVRRLSESFLKEGDSAVLGENTLSYSDLQNLYGAE